MEDRAPSSRNSPASEGVSILPASQFSLEELTAAYNQTRVDYLIPMPMTPARLEAYIQVYDVDLAQSRVIVSRGEIGGLAMLGVRPGRTWVTRLGVLPSQRRHGAGEVLVRALLEATDQLGCPLSILEVIEGNLPARALFEKLGFRPKRILQVLRRSAGPPAVEPRSAARWLGEQQALELVALYPQRLPWTNEWESYLRGNDAQGLAIDLGAAGQGWLVFRRQNRLLSHLLFDSQDGDPQRIAVELLAHLYHRFPQLDTHLENISAADPHAPALDAHGFLEEFRRIEMHRVSRNGYQGGAANQDFSS